MRYQRRAATVVLAAAFLTSCASSSRAQPLATNSSGTNAAGAPTWSPWGSALVQDGMPVNPRLPMIQADSSAGRPLVQPSPSWSAASGVASPAPAAAASRPSPMNPFDAVYLDKLMPPAPPEVRVAGLTEDTVAPMNQVIAEPGDPLPPGAREGVFQKIYFTGTWLPSLSGEPDALGFGDLETGVVLGFPFFRRDTPLLVTPQFGTHLLENTASLDIPNTLFDASVEFRHLRKFGNGPWAMDVAANVGYYSDYEQGSGDALRVSGRGIGIYETAPTTKWLLGVAYVNRAGASVLPVAGVIHEPQPNLRLELIFPRPRVLWKTPGSIDGDERWLYLGGEFGGGVWSITRPSNGSLDVMNYSDWRVLAGYERKVTGGLSRRIELGYVFQRELEFDSEAPDASLDDTLFVRGGLTY